MCWASWRRAWTPPPPRSRMWRPPWRSTSACSASCARRSTPLASSPPRVPSQGRGGGSGAERRQMMKATTPPPTRRMRASAGRNWRGMSCWRGSTRSSTCRRCCARPCASAPRSSARRRACSPRTASSPTLSAPRAPRCGGAARSAAAGAAEVPAASALLLVSDLQVRLDSVVGHLDPSVWGEDAQQFRPERFDSAEGSIVRRARCCLAAVVPDSARGSVCLSPLAWADRAWVRAVPQKVEHLDYKFLTFGAGVRPCIGRHLSVMEMKVRRTRASAAAAGDRAGDAAAPLRGGADEGSRHHHRPGDALVQGGHRHAPRLAPAPLVPCTCTPLRRRCGVEPGWPVGDRMRGSLSRLARALCVEHEDGDSLPFPATPLRGVHERHPAARSGTAAKRRRSACSATRAKWPLPPSVHVRGAVPLSYIYIHHHDVWAIHR
eukprot:scaffold2930_cov376-Prasinococcus_capsulatus_cf.AAC.6